MTKLLQVQEFLKSGKTLDVLKLEHGINYNIQNGKVSLNYDQIDSRESDTLACQCRGLVIEENSWNIIACPMFRFFNYGQGSAADIDFNNARLLLKLDGTMLIVYQYQDRWFVATRSRAEATIPNENGLNFTQLTDMAIQEMSGDKSDNLQKFMKNAPKDNTYIFELTTPLNQVYCNYDKFFITLLAVRNNITLEEDFPDNHLIHFDKKYNLTTPEEYEISSLSSIVELVSSWNPKEKEGVVLRDNNFNRIKIKNPSYAAMSHLRDSLTTSTRNCIKIILLGKDDDIINDIPKFIANRIISLKEYIGKMKSIILKEYKEIKDIDNMKEFASKAEFTIWPAAMYSLKRNKVKDINEFFCGGSKYKNADIPSVALDNILFICKKLGYVEDIISFG